MRLPTPQPFIVNPAIATASSTVSYLREQPSPAAQAPDLRWDFAMICVAGYILTAVGRVHQLFPAVGSLRPAILTALFAIALYFFDRHEQRRSKYVLNATTTKLLLVLLAWMVLSVSGALVISRSFDVVFNNFMKTALMYLVVAGMVRGIRDVERLALVYLVSATLYAIVVIMRFDLGSGDAWRLGHLYYYDANDFATFAVSGMPFAVYFLHSGRRLSGRMCAALSLAILSLAFVRTGSRGGFVALLAMIAFIVLRYSAIALRQRVFGTALVVLVVLMTASDRYWAQMSTIFSDADYNRTEESGRMQIWARGVGYMLRHPVFGVGPGNFQAAEGMLSPFADRVQMGVGVRWNAAHNTYVQAGAELGVPGLVLFLTMIGSAFTALRRSTRSIGVRDDIARRPELTQAITASLTGFVVGAFFLSLAYSEMLYTLLALVVALQKVTRMAATRGPTAGAAG